MCKFCSFGFFFDIFKLRVILLSIHLFGLLVTRHYALLWTAKCSWSDVNGIAFDK